MSSTEVWEAASISMTSMARPSVMALHMAHLPQGSPLPPVLGFSQFTALASILPVLVLPVPRGPQKR